MSEVTRMLEAVQQGDPKAAEELLPLVYEELRHLAAAKMAKEAPGQTLQPTALVHEAWLRLVGNDEIRFANRAHFFAAAAQAMRRILIENARRKQSPKHGADNSWSLPCELVSKWREPAYTIPVPAAALSGWRDPALFPPEPAQRCWVRRFLANTAAFPAAWDQANHSFTVTLRDVCALGVRWYYVWQWRPR